MATVLLGISWTLSTPLEASPRDVAFVTVFLVMCALTGQTILGYLNFLPGSPTLTLLGPGLLLGSMTFVGLEWLRVEIGVSATWLSPALLLAIVALRLRASLSRVAAPFNGTEVVAVGGVAALGLGYGRPLLLAAGLAFVGAAVLGVAAAGRARTAWRTVAILAGVALAALHAAGQSRLGVAEAAETFHESLALGVTAADGADRLLDRTLRYHWLGHLVAGGAARSLDLSTLVATNVVVPTIALVGTASTVFIAATQLGARRMLGGVGVAIAIVASASSFEQLTFGTDVQSANVLSTSWLVVGTYVVVELWRRQSRRLGALLILAGLGAATSGAKFSHGIVLFVVSSALVVGTSHRTRDWSVPAAVGVGVGITYVALIRGGTADEMVELLPIREATSLFLPLSETAKTSPVAVLTVMFVVIFVTHFVARTPHLLGTLSDHVTRRVVTALVLGGLSISLPTVLFAWGEERNLYWLSGALTSVGVAVAGLSSPTATDGGRGSRRLTTTAFAVGIAVMVPLALRVRYELRDAPAIRGHWNTLTLIVFAWPLISVVAVALATLRAEFRGAVVNASTAALIGATFGLYLFVAAGESIVRPVMTVSQPDGEATEPTRVSGLLSAGEWIRHQDADADTMLATNVVCDGESCPYETYSLGTASRLPVLYEGALASYRHFDPEKFVRDAERKKRLSIDFATTADRKIAAALVDLGVRWYVMRESTETLTRTTMCTGPAPWQCVLTLPDTLVLDLDPDRQG
ncbi:MAG: hypothetical protein ACKORC_02235 [Acidimicrobiia bacterium]